MDIFSNLFQKIELHESRSQNRIFLTAQHHITQGITQPY